MEKVFRKVRYKTLSPLHIGDGNILSNLEYFLYNGKIYLYKSEDLQRFLTRQFEDFINYALSTMNHPASSDFLEPIVIQNKY
ncbi:MAG: hypothetical protein C4291_10415 [Candidatus Dadabacteria bacterium]